VFGEVLERRGPFAEEAPHVALEEQSVRHTTEQAQGRGVAEVVDHGRSAIDLTEHVPMREGMEGAAHISSTSRCGGSQRVILTVSRCLTPR
jgi:hypothetical protein